MYKSNHYQRGLTIIELLVAMAISLVIVIAAAYIILRNMLDVRVHSSEELIEKYDIPVLGNIPSFEVKGSSNSEKAKTDSYAVKGDE